MEKTAFITGITGQDGSYLTELLLEKGYIVHGLAHYLEVVANSQIKHLVADPSIINKTLFLHSGALEDATLLRRVIHKTKPAELYHLAGQSSPRMSLEQPETTVESAGMSTLRLLEILKDMDTPARFLCAASSEIFGNPATSPQDENTPVRPVTPYGAAKAFSQQITSIYRNAHKMPACSAILYNHESVRRSPAFVTMKIARAAAMIKQGRQKELLLGSLEARRDWGWAPDYVAGMWRMLQAGARDDYILASGKLHSVADFAEKAFECVGLNWRDHVKHDDSLMTPAEPVALCGDPAKAERELHWNRTVDFEEMIARLVASQYTTD